MNAIVSLSRRRFLQAGAMAAGSLLLGFYLPPGGRLAKAAEPDETAINAWLRIAPDNTVTIIVAHSEMGQGVYTALPMLVAEELEVDWQQVRAEMAPAAKVYANRMFGMQATGGSTSVRSSFDHLRQAGAAAREMLRQAAAERWGVPLAECAARDGSIVHQGTDRSLAYGELAEAAGRLEAPENPTLKKPQEWRLIGKATPRLDTPLKVNGSAVFGIDVKRDGMLIGSVTACPVFGGKLQGVDKAPALAVKGVHSVVTLADAVIVLAENYWQAKKGLDALSPDWAFGEHAGMSSEGILESFHRALNETGAVAHEQGEVETAYKNAAKTVEAVFEAPYLAHATMEPMNATARVHENGVEVWAPTQGQDPIRMAVSAMLGLQPEQVQVHTTFLGGGFGRRFEVDFVVQAVAASKAAGRPVKLVWSREEDTRHDFYRPAAVSRFQVGLDEDGMPAAWKNRIVGPSIFTRVNPDWIQNGVDRSAVEGAADLPYAIPHQRIDYVMENAGVPVGFWRSVGHSLNAFFVETLLDELARAAGKDPVEYRLALLKDQPRFQKVLRTAAEAAGWNSPAPQGRHRGAAIHLSFGSIVAEVAEISIDGGDIRVHKVACAVDCGRVVNPDTVKAQMESGIVYGLTAALYGEIHVAQGRVEEGNFDHYRMLKLAEMPAIEVRIVESGEALGGIGEPATPPIAPAVANAVLAATGKPVRRLPIRLG